MQISAMAGVQSALKRLIFLIWAKNFMKTLTKAVGSSMDGFLVQHSEVTKVGERLETTTRNQGHAPTGKSDRFRQ